jgi:hypothetical protein
VRIGTASGTCSSSAGGTLHLHISRAGRKVLAARATKRVVLVGKGTDAHGNRTAVRARVAPALVRR